jgi:putative ABC transport system permease protein
MFGNALIQAIKEIRRNFLRSILTAIGIVIGIASVVAMVNIGKGASQSITNSISSLGSNTLFISPGQRGGPGGKSVNAKNFTLKDIDTLRSSVYSISAISPFESASLQVIYKGTNYSTSLMGIQNDYLKGQEITLKYGREFSKSEINSGKNVCIIGQTVYNNLFQEGVNPVGEKIRLNKFSCQIIGLTNTQGGDTFGRDRDDVVYSPISFVQRRFTGSTEISRVFVAVKDGISITEAKAQITEVLREQRGLKKDAEDDFNIRDLKSIIDTLSQITGVLTIMLGAVAGISLIVGGIGIMNIMLVSVTERTREIGIKMAIGATKKDILSQFLIESTVLSLIGGVVGLILGMAITYGVSEFMDIVLIIDIPIAVTAILFSMFIGVLFGYIPAKKAANLNPIEALRYE